MQALIKRSKKHRLAYGNKELNYYISAALFKNKILPAALQLKDNNRLLTANNSPKISKIKNICVFTGRSRAVVSKSYKLSRIQFKDFVELGKLPGIKKY